MKTCVKGNYVIKRIINLGTIFFLKKSTIVIRYAGRTRHFRAILVICVNFIYIYHFIKIITIIICTFNIV